MWNPRRSPLRPWAGTHRVRTLHAREVSAMARGAAAIQSNTRKT